MSKTPEDTLQELIGLTEVKNLLTQQIAFNKVNHLRKQHGIYNDTVNHHLVFSENPGTGKTEVARLYTKILFNNKIIQENKLVEVGRADLIGEYIGSTAPKVKKVFDDAKGGGALAALKTVIRDKNYYNPVYIYGKEGVGKSHLLNTTINAIVERNKVVFLSAKELAVEMVEKIMLSDDDYILIDDLQLLPKDKALEEKIAMLIEANKKQVIISSTIDPNSMEVSSTLQERLQWGLTTNMTSQNQ